jgi:hypothetical protein
MMMVEEDRVGIGNVMQIRFNYFGHFENLNKKKKKIRMRASKIDFNFLNSLSLLTHGNISEFTLPHYVSFQA